MSSDHPRDEPDWRNPKKPRVSPPTSKRLLLANLRYNVTEPTIVDFFRDRGADVDRVTLIKVPPDNRVNGNAYVYLPDQRSIDVALRQDGNEFHGRMLRVSLMPEDQRTACVRGMPARTTVQELKQLFAGCKILDARSKPNRGGPPDISTWFVDFADDESFHKALALDRSRDGLMICIATAQGKERRPSRRMDDERSLDRTPRLNSTPKMSREGSERHRDDRPPRDDRLSEDRPREERGRDDRSRDDRPRDDRPRDDRPREDRPRDDRPREDRPRDDRSRDDRPRDDRPREDRPREEPPRDDRPRDERPREERLREDSSRDDRPREDRPREDRPRDDRYRAKDDRGPPPPRDDSIRDRYGREPPRDRDDRREDRPRDDRRMDRPRNSRDDRHRDRDDRGRDDRRYDDRLRDYDRRDDDRYGDSRWRSRSRSPPRYDRDRRIRDRREHGYPRNSPPGYREYGDRRGGRYDDRDYFRGHDRYPREYRRSHGFDRDHRGNYPRERHDRPLDTAVTCVLTNLPFCEDRERVISMLGQALEDMCDRLHINEIIPVGRRCGACVVIFRDPESYARAVAMNSITISQRKVHILPLEMPAAARVQKLNPDFNVDEIIQDMRRLYNVESLYVKMRQNDQIVLGIEDSRFLVRLLDIDGRPLVHSKYATVSYIPSRPHSDSRPRRSPEEFGDSNGRGGSSHRDNRNGDNPDDKYDGDRHGSRDGHRDSRRDHSSADQGRDSKKPVEGALTLQFASEQSMGKDFVEKSLCALGLNDLSLEVSSAGTVVVKCRTEHKDIIDKLYALAESEEEFKELASAKISLLKSEIGSTRGTQGRSPSHELRRAGSAHEDGDRDRSPGMRAKDRKHHSRKSEPRSSPDNKRPSPNGSGTEPDRKKMKLESTVPSVMTVSPMTPSPSEYSSGPKARKVAPDPNLPNIVDRLNKLRPVITGTTSKDDKLNYEEFCNNLHAYCTPQKLVYTLDENIDPEPPVVWKGTVQKGVMVNSEGILVLRSAQEDESVRRMLRALPKEIDIELKAPWNDDKFAHLMTPECVSLIVKAAEDEPQKPRESRSKGRMPRNREYFRGIIQSLRCKQRMGINRYMYNGQKYLCLCIPPNPYVFKRMRLPWRFQDLAGHDTLLVVCGPRVPTPQLV